MKHFRLCLLLSLLLLACAELVVAESNDLDREIIQSVLSCFHSLLNFCVLDYMSFPRDLALNRS